MSQPRPRLVCRTSFHVRKTSCRNKGQAISTFCISAPQEGQRFLSQFTPGASMLATRQRGCAAGHWLFVRSVPAVVAARMSLHGAQSVCPQGRQRMFARTPPQSGRRRYRSTTAYTVRPYRFTSRPDRHLLLLPRRCNSLRGVVQQYLCTDRRHTISHHCRRVSGPTQTLVWLNANLWPAWHRLSDTVRRRLSSLTKTSVPIAACRVISFMKSERLPSRIIELRSVAPRTSWQAVISQEVEWRNSI